MQDSHAAQGRKGRSFNPDEFAIHLEQVIARTAPEDYRHPKQFFARTCFTRALREHAGMALRRLSGETVNTAPVMTRELSPLSQPLYHYFYCRQHGADGKPQSHPMPKTYG